MLNVQYFTLSFLVGGRRGIAKSSQNGEIVKEEIVAVIDKSLISPSKEQVEGEGQVNLLRNLYT